MNPIQKNLQKSKEEIKEDIDNLWLDIHNKGKLTKEILNKVKSIIKRYIDTSEENIDILALWVIGTYFHSQFETFPILQLYAQKRSGKTRTLKLLSSIADKSDGSVSTAPTETHLFRHKEGALFFDEMENISSKERGAFRETLNAVYKRGNKITRYKEVKKEGSKEWVEENFYPYYPIALANINGLNDVLGDRAVQIILKRSNKKITKLVEDFSTNKEIKRIKNELSLISAEIPKDFFTEWNNYIQGIKTDNSLIDLFEKIQKTEIYGRNLELFFPLIIISYLCNDVDSFLETAKELVLSKEEEEAIDDLDERLKKFILEKSYSDFMNLYTILNEFKETLESSEVWMREKWLSNSLKRLGLIKRKRNLHGKTQILINISTKPTTTTNPTNPTNPTYNQVEQVEQVGIIEKKEGREEIEKEDSWEDSLFK